MRRWNGGEDEGLEGRKQLGREEAEKGQVEEKSQEVYEHIKGRAQNRGTSVG